MKKLLFIGYDFHLKTRSSDFILKELADTFQVTKYFVNLNSKHPYSALSNFKDLYFDYLVCWQVIPPKKFINEVLNFGQGAFFPMYDGAPNPYKIEKWWHLRTFQIICFSKKLHNALTKLGFSSHYIQYFPEAQKVASWGDSKSLFFWTRRDELNLSRIREVIQNLELESIHLHTVPDPSNTEQTLFSCDRYNYTFSDWFETKDEMLKKVMASAYYIAPRFQEGIGMSFLEAMSMGRCVIAFDDSTMNEYIEDGVTGYLFNKTENPIKPVPIETIQSQTYEYMSQGRKNWMKEKAKIVQWIKNRAEYKRIKLWCFLLLRCLRSPLKVISYFVK